MRRTDYEGIAARYDDNPLRLRVPDDAVLAQALERLARRPLVALDLACGTGNYLAAQRQAHGAAVRWHGLDASEAMLACAREKVHGVELVAGRAERLPWDAAHFDYVVTSFAFHHFEDKPRALDEITRVSKPDGAFRLVNIDPSRMRRSWLYRFFPEAEREDDARFWSPELIGYELERRGWDVRTRIEITMGPTPLAEALADAERRELSQLAILDDAGYARGLERLRAEATRDPGGSIPSEMAVVTIAATRGG